MYPFYTRYTFSFLVLLGLLATSSADAQKLTRTQPTWWFGESAGANVNELRGNIQMLNSSRTVPTAFHTGQSVKPYASLLAEYRPNKNWGGMINIAYDNRGGKFEQEIAPCNCAADLSVNMSYLSIEPAVRFAPFASGFYVFAGPTLSINLSKDFRYTQEKQPDTRADLSDVRKLLFAAQAGVGIDFPVSARNAAVQMTLSPFASFQTDLLQLARSSGDLSIYSIRAGLAVKFGKGKPALLATPAIIPVIPSTDMAIKKVPALSPLVVVRKEIRFSVQAPKLSLPVIQSNELLPLLNAVFFDAGTTDIPARYTQLSKSSARLFSEDELQRPGNSHAIKQMAAYHHILNVVGSRMNSYPLAKISLSGTGLENNPMAENIKRYLVTVFDIDAARISIEKGSLATQVSGMDPLRIAEERRIDINSPTPEILAQIGELKINTSLPDVTKDNVRFTAYHATELLTRWSVQLISEDGSVQVYGPFQQDEITIPSTSILQNKQVGNYTVKMLGQTKVDSSISKESFLSLATPEKTTISIPPFSVLFGFDKSMLTSAYEKFLTQTVAPLVGPNATVTIFGYADVIGADSYNRALSKARVENVLRILKVALQGKTITFKSYGFGKEEGISPFANQLPEERFYNRTIWIGIDQGTQK